MVAPYTGSGDSFTAEAPHPWSTVQITQRGPNRNFDVHPDGKRIISSSSDQTVKVWDPVIGQETLTLKGHTAGVTSVAISSDGLRVASGSWDQTVRLWDATEQKK